MHTHTLIQIYTHTTSTPCVYTISKVSNSHVFHPSSMCWSPLIFFYQFIPHLCWTVPLSQCPTARRLGGFNYLQLKHGALLIVCAAAQRHKVCNAFWFILRTHVSAMHSHTHPHTQTHMHKLKWSASHFCAHFRDFNLYLSTLWLRHPPRAAATPLFVCMIACVCVCMLSSSPSVINVNVHINI